MELGGGSSGSSSATALSLAAFLFSAVLYTRDIRRRRRRRRRPPCDDEFDDSLRERDVLAMDGALEALRESGAGDSVSSRGLRAAIRPPASYWNGFMLCLQDPCDPLANPEGHIALCVAENKLVQEALATRLMRPDTAMTAFSQSDVYSYNGFLGLPSARQAVAYFLERRFLMTDGDDVSTTGSVTGDENTEIRMEGALTGVRSNVTEERDMDHGPGSDPDRIDPEHVALGSGCGSLLSNVLQSLCNAGDAVLIPAPYRAAFDNDVRSIACCAPFPVPVSDMRKGPSKEDLEAAALRAERLDQRVRVLLLTNPHDPTGVVYRPSSLRRVVAWARERKMHVIVDEVYALSVHEDGGPIPPFKSVVRVLRNSLRDDVHMLYSLSKDFGAGGFRFGVLYSQNTLLLRALANLNIFSGVSHPMQRVVSEILTDDQFVDSFLSDARAQLRWSYTLCARKLEEMVVPFFPATGGLFLYADFSGLLPEFSFDGEERFAALVRDAARVVLTPGSSMHDKRPGMFRLCYAWVTPDVLEIAMERLSYLVTKIRRNHGNWDALDLSTLSDVTKCGMPLGMRRNPSIDLRGLTHAR
uniref:Aminotransferase class I/classII large domain-containing protein n=2 Tax=Odontella aurita TaxID=265563 RepID=A0A7S4MMU1_9STRA|mmetsp:Transcript_26482/g.78373  ORF Transcript_26482/g.78373 Transcript_26482/m.78373 type:complete len:584 (+) Transcript_26482:196-1947(+)|eukprot:CAMPEP_0113586084 /NCGR_PEP_ID=MMETSP0015_2-20120614/34098_1 /TAXON_ID=2838 /ORGANISM="Odontella" /LENGTH=583 /DNA_ID=CAMNT_0000491477 /DNA_START=170 /DNA_END=1921 /DNA_ORIENTATION=+ /assembly_acc=CAM_ASM_000160